MSEKPSNSKGESNKDLDDLLDSEYCELNMDFKNYISRTQCNPQSLMMLLFVVFFPPIL